MIEFVVVLTCAVFVVSPGIVALWIERNYMRWNGWQFLFAFAFLICLVLFLTALLAGAALYTMEKEGLKPC